MTPQVLRPQAKEKSSQATEAGAEAAEAYSRGYCVVTLLRMLLLKRDPIKVFVNKALILTSSKVTSIPKQLHVLLPIKAFRLMLVLQRTLAVSTSNHSAFLAKLNYWSGT